MATEQETPLDEFLKQHTQDKTWKPLPDELAFLVDVFLPTIARPTRSKGFIALSATCQLLRDNSTSSQDQDASVSPIVQAFFPPLLSKLADTQESNALAGLSFLTALFQVDGQAATATLQRDGILESIIDAIELFASSTLISRAIAQLVAQAAGHKRCRAIIPPECVQWLELKLKQSKDDEIRASAAVALVKLSQGAEVDAAAITGAGKPAVSDKNNDLLLAMKNLVISKSTSAAVSDAVEGLAYMSAVPEVKEQLSKDTSFLSRLFANIPRKTSITEEEGKTTPVYGTVMIIANICAYHPRLSEEESQLAKLKRMASAAQKGGGTEGLDVNVLEDDEHVKERCRRLIKAGALEVLTATVRTTESRATKLTIGKALLSMVEDQQNRGKVLQAGGAKALVSIIHALVPTPSSSKPNTLPPLERADIEPIQALAKLCITSSPVQVFGPNEGAIYDAIRPLNIMLQYPSSNLLQRFEALMALTNLASHSAQAAGRVATAEGLLSKVELLMLEDHVLVRRAATELICNLIVGSEDVFNKYGGEKASGSQSKLHVLVAMCDVDDLQTRLAASGAIATLTSSSDACQMLVELQREKKRVLRILGQLIDASVGGQQEEDDEDDANESANSTESDPGLVHRGVVCIRNLLANVNPPARKEVAGEAERIGLVAALIRTVAQESNPNSVVMRPAVEALKSIMGTGITISVPM